MSKIHKQFLRTTILIASVLGIAIGFFAAKELWIVVVVLSCFALYISFEHQKLQSLSEDELKHLGKS